MLQHTITDRDTTITVDDAPDLTGVYPHKTWLGEVLPPRFATVEPAQIIVREWAQDEIVIADVSGPRVKRSGRLSRRWITVQVTLETPEAPAAVPNFAPDWVCTLANRVRA